MKLLHPTVKLLQCAESKEESQLKSYLERRAPYERMKLEQLEEVIMEIWI